MLNKPISSWSPTPRKSLKKIKLGWESPNQPQSRWVKLRFRQSEHCWRGAWRRMAVMERHIDCAQVTVTGVKRQLQHHGSRGYSANSNGPFTNDWFRTGWHFEACVRISEVTSQQTNTQKGLKRGREGGKEREREKWLWLHTVPSLQQFSFNLKSGAKCWKKKKKFENWYFVLFLGRWDSLSIALSFLKFIFFSFLKLVKTMASVALKLNDFENWKASQMMCPQAGQQVWSSFQTHQPHKPLSFCHMLTAS